MIDVSIIIPVYNTGDYLKRCVESLINQCKNMEILLIDDCSTDNSKEVAIELEKEYKFVKLIALGENQGVSNARNIGIENAKGKYIMFSDADDWYEPNAVERLLEVANSQDADFITANYYISYENKKIKVDTSSYFSKDMITKEEIVSYMTLTSCSKLIKKDLFMDNFIEYPTDVTRCEELQVIPVLAYYANNPIAIDDTLYNYYQRENSASNKKEKDISYYDKTFNKFKDKIDETKYKEELEFRAIEHLLYGKTLVMLKSRFSRNEILKHLKKFKTEYPNFINNKYLKRFNKAKKIFIYTLNYKLLLLSKIFALLHERITG